MMVYKFHLLRILQYSCLYWWFLDYTSWGFCNISGVLWQLVGGLKINIIVSISPEPIICVLKLNKQLVTMAIIYDSQYWSPAKNLIRLEVFLIIIRSKIQCCQDNKGVYCCGPTSATISIKLIQIPSAPIKPLEVLTYHQVGSCTLSKARWNQTTEFCNSPSF